MLLTCTPNSHSNDMSPQCPGSCPGPTCCRWEASIGTWWPQMSSSDQIGCTVSESSCAFKCNVSRNDGLRFFFVEKHEKRSIRPILTILNCFKMPCLAAHPAHHLNRGLDRSCLLNPLERAEDHRISLGAVTLWVKTTESDHFYLVGGFNHSEKY